MNRNVTRSILGVALAISLLCPLMALAQQAAKPYHDGPVWEIAFISKGGHGRPLPEVSGRRVEARAGSDEEGRLHSDYKVIATEPHGTQDFNVILMTEFKDLATMEANAEKRKPSANNSSADSPRSRADIRTAELSRSDCRRLAREIILAPKAKYCPTAGLAPRRGAFCWATL